MKKSLPVLGLLLLMGCQSTMVDSMALWKPGAGRTQTAKPTATAEGATSASKFAAGPKQPSKSGVALAGFPGADNSSAARLAGESGILTSSQRATATDSIEDILRQGHVHLTDGRLDLAKSAYNRILNQQPNHVVANHRLAVIADKQRDYATAERHYVTALRVNDSDANVLSDLGYSYLLQQRYPDAEQQLQRALEIQPSHSKAQNNLGLLYGKMGDYDKCLAAFRQTGSEAEAQAKVASQFPLGRPSPAAAQFAGPPRTQPAQHNLGTPPQRYDIGATSAAQAGLTQSPAPWNPNQPAAGVAQSIPPHAAGGLNPASPAPLGGAQQPPGPFPVQRGPNSINQLASGVPSNNWPVSQPPQYAPGPANSSTPSPTAHGAIGEPVAQSHSRSAVPSSFSSTARPDTGYPNRNQPGETTAPQSPAAWPPETTNSGATAAFEGNHSQVWPPEPAVNPEASPTTQQPASIQPMSHQQPQAMHDQPAAVQQAAWSHDGLAPTHSAGLQTPIAVAPANLETPLPAWNDGRHAQAPQQYTRSDQAQREATYLGMSAGPGAVLPILNQPQPNAQSAASYATPNAAPYRGGATGNPAQSAVSPQPTQWPPVAQGQGYPQPSQPQYAVQSQPSQPQYATQGQSTSQTPYQNTQAYNVQPEVRSPLPYGNSQYSPWQN